MVGGMAEKQFVTPEHIQVRNTLRVAGPIIFSIGLILAIISFVDMVTARGEPTLFWLGFIGLPLMFVGGSLSMYGFMGAMTRYAMREGAPVSAQTFNYMAEETRDGIKTSASALASGLREGFAPQEKIFCTQCGRESDADAKFCKYCGKAMVS